MSNKNISYFEVKRGSCCDRCSRPGVPAGGKVYLAIGIRQLDSGCRTGVNCFRLSFAGVHHRRRKNPSVGEDKIGKMWHDVKI